MEGKQKHDLQQAVQLDMAPWLHAYELRFLIGNSARRPKDERKAIQKKPHLLVPVPEKHALRLNLLVGRPGTDAGTPLPAFFGSSCTRLWQPRLRDGRLALLLGRITAFEASDENQIWAMREDLGLTLNSQSAPKEENYVELFSFHTTTDRTNLIHVIPMGDEVFRHAVAAAYEHGLPPLPPRELSFEFENCSVDITAPNGDVVARVRLESDKVTLSLEKWRRKTTTVGQVQLMLDSKKLIRGSSFFTAPTNISCQVCVCDALPKAWQLAVVCKFDGFCFRAEIRQSSTALLNKNLETPIASLQDDERLAVVLPEETLVLSTDLDVLSSEANLVASFSLTDQL